MKTILKEIREDAPKLIFWCCAFWLVYLAVLYATFPELL